MTSTDDISSKLSESTTEGLGTLKAKAQTVAADAAGKAAGIVADAKSGASGVAGNIGAALREGAETQKTAGADAVASLAQSARGAAGTIEEKSPEVARLVRTSADAVERLSSQIRDQSISELFDSISNFANRQPVAFFGCGVLAGIVLARLLAPSHR